MAEKKYLNLTGLTRYDGKIKEYIGTSTQSAKDYADSLATNYDAAGTAQTKMTELANGAVATNAAAIATLNGNVSTAGSVAKSIKDYVDTLDSSVSATASQTNAKYVLTGVTQTDGVLTAKSEQLLAAVAVTGAAADVSVSNANLDATDLESALTELATNTNAATVTVTKDTSSSDYAAVYHIQQNNQNVGVAINIPKDMVVQSGSVKTATADAPLTINGSSVTSGTYIEIVLANNDGSKIYIPVDSLIEYVTGGATAEITVSVDASTHVATASINSGSIAKGKLTTAVQASLDLADSSVQSVTATASTGTDGTITVDGVEVAVKGLGSAAFTESSAYDASGAAATAKSEVLGSATTDTASSKTIEGLTKRAAAIEGRLDTLEADTYVEITNAEVDALFA